MTTEGVEGDHLNNHSHNHSHHGGGDHSHALSVDADRRYLTVALLLIVHGL
jgi:cobalt-zinc-cadmium efflux system protein